jgi:hypothetical protein
MKSNLCIIIITILIIVNNKIIHFIQLFFILVDFFENIAPKYKSRRFCYIKLKIEYYKICLLCIFNK